MLWNGRDKPVLRPLEGTKHKMNGTTFSTGALPWM